MKILKIDRKNQFFEVIPQILDDFWHLEKVLEKGDIVTGRTFRKIKPKEAGQEPIKQKITVDLQVEEIVFDSFDGSMRVAGLIVGGYPDEFIELNAHHSLSLDLGKKVKVKKNELKDYQIERLKKAEASHAKAKVTVVLLDDEHANIALLSDYGLQEKAGITGSRQGKQFKENPKNEQTYFDEIISKVKEMGLDKLIIAGPGFTKENFNKYLDEKNLDLQIIMEATNSVGKTGFNELMKKDIGSKAIQELEIVKESKLVEKLFAEISKEGLIAYGFDDVKHAVEIGACEELLLTDKLLTEKRDELEELMNLTEKMKGKLHIISSEHDAGKQLHNIGGIACFLRYKIQ